MDFWGEADRVVLRYGATKEDVQAAKELFPNAEIIIEKSEEDQ